MLIYENFYKMLNAPAPIRAYLSSLPGCTSSSFNNDLGGDVFVLTNLLEVLDLIHTLCPRGAEAIDSAQWIDKDKTWAVFFLATNNAGGPIYFVHNAMVESSAILKEIMRLTAEKQEEMKRQNAR